MVTREIRRSIKEYLSNRSPINLRELGPQCKLFVLKVEGASNLAKKDIFGLSDPYVRVRFRGLPDKIIHYPLSSTTTPTAPRTLHPRWNHTFYFLVTTDQFTVILDVFDQNTLIKDDHLGRAFLHFDFLGHAAQHPNVWTEQDIQSRESVRFTKPLKQKYSKHLLAELRTVAGMPHIRSLVHEYERKTITHRDLYKGASGKLLLSYYFLSPHIPEAVTLMTEVIKVELEGIIPLEERQPDQLFTPSAPAEAAREEDSSSTGDEQQSTPTPAPPTGLLRLISEGHTSEETDSDPEEDPLPEGWEQGTDSNGRHFFRNHLTRTITLRRPGRLRPPADGRSYLPRMDSTDIMELPGEESEEDQDEQPPDLASGHMLESLQISIGSSTESTPTTTPPTTPTPTNVEQRESDAGHPLTTSVQATPTSVTPTSTTPTSVAPASATPSAPTLEPATTSSFQAPPEPVAQLAVPPNQPFLQQSPNTRSSTATAPSQATAATAAGIAAFPAISHRAVSAPSLSPQQLQIQKLRQGLPPGWDVARLASGTIYYVDHINKKTTWDRPRMQERKLVMSEKAISSAAVTQDLDLPEGWEKRMTNDGKPYYIDHNSKTTQWEHPNASGTSRESLGPLPHGWEMKQMQDGRIFFIDHTTKSTQWEDPRLQAKNKPTARMEYSRHYKLKYANFVSRLRPKHPTSSLFRINIRRDNLLEDSFSGIMNVSDLELLKSRLWIEFEGERGYDYGGVSREWFYLLSREVFNPYYGLFEYSASDDYTLQINPDSGIYNSNHIAYFTFTGRICALAVFHKRLIDAFFIRPFYKLMLRKKVTLQDMQSVDVELYNSVQYILENDPEPLCLTFAVNKTVFGEVLEEELMDGGANVPVTEANKKDYIKRLIDWRFTKRVQPQMDAFLKGFSDVIPLHLISIFDERELEYLLGGLAEIDVNDWRRNTEYVGYYSTDGIIVWFWKAVENYDDEMRARLLQFVTGTSKVPMNGFAELQGSNGPRKFCIKKYGHPSSLPRAHTCFNRIDLPPYVSYHQLKENLRLAVENTEGFEGVD